MESSNLRPHFSHIRTVSFCPLEDFLECTSISESGGFSSRHSEQVKDQLAGTKCGIDAT